MFLRLVGLIGNENLDLIKNKKVLLVGIGGVGGTTLECLVRCGFSNITIVDYDKFELSNINRQIICDSSSLGKYKVDVALDRYKDINPQVDLKVLKCKLDENSKDVLFYEKYDYIIDACDSIDAKCILIKYALDNNIKIVSSMGVGGRIEPSLVKLTRLDKTVNDPLAKKLRNMLRKDNISLKIPVVASSELPQKFDNEISSIITVASTAGILLAHYVIMDIIKKNN